MKKYIVVEIEVPDEEAAGIDAEYWMAAFFEVAKLTQARKDDRSWKHGDPVPDHPFRPRAYMELDFGKSQLHSVSS